MPPQSELYPLPRYAVVLTFPEYMYVRGRFASGDWNFIRSYPMLQEIKSITVQLVVPKLPAHRPALVCKVNRYVFQYVNIWNGYKKTVK